MDESGELYLPLKFASLVCAVAIATAFWGWVGLFWLGVALIVARDTTKQITEVFTMLQKEQIHPR